MSLAYAYIVASTMNAINLMPSKCWLQTLPLFQSKAFRSSETLLLSRVFVYQQFLSKFWLMDSF